MSDEEVVEEESGAESMHLVTDDISPIAGIGTLVFGKWDSTEVTCQDPGISPYINLRTVGTPHSGGRHANAWMGKAKLSVIERFINGLMRTGRNGGKKKYAAKAFEEALDVIHERTNENPLQIFVDAITHSAPMEEVTRIKFGACITTKGCRQCTQSSIGRCHSQFVQRQSWLRHSSQRER